MSQKLIVIPASLVPKFEAWGELTVRLFRKLRRQPELNSSQIDEDQVWHWTERWQQWERKADEDIAAGKTIEFDTINKLIESLDA